MKLKTKSAYARPNPDLLKLVILYFLVGTSVGFIIFPPLVVVIAIIGIIHIVFHNKKMNESGSKFENIEERAR